MINLADLAPPVRDLNIAIQYDADALLYMAGYVCQHAEEEENTTPVTLEDGTTVWVEPESNVSHLIDCEVNKVKDLFRTENIKFYFTNGKGFRGELATIKPYKGTRSGARPYHYQTALNYFLTKYICEVSNILEADDVACMNQHMLIEAGEPTVLVHVDKDLDMMPGYHFNPRKETLYFVSEKDGVDHFFSQLVQGDTVDNIGGVPRKGKVAAAALIDKNQEALTCEARAGFLKHDVLDLYNESHEKGKFPEHVATGSDAMLENARLLWMIRKPGDNWSWSTEYSVPNFENCVNIEEMIRGV